MQNSTVIPEGNIKICQLACFDLLFFIVFRAYIWSDRTFKKGWNCHQNVAQLYFSKEVYSDNHIIRTVDFRLRMSFQIFEMTAIQTERIKLNEWMNLRLDQKLHLAKSLWLSQTAHEFVLTSSVSFRSFSTPSFMSLREFYPISANMSKYRPMHGRQLLHKLSF